MIKIKICLVIACINCTQQLYACNSCAQVSTVGSSSSLLQNVLKNYVSIQYQHAIFKQNGAGYSSTKDRMQSLVLEAKFKCYKRLFLSVNLPWHYKRRTFAHRNVVNQGIGDMHLMADYRFANIKLSKQATINPILNLGVKLPTGRYQHYIKSYDIPRSFNNGTGACAIVFNPIVITNYKRVGWSNSYVLIRNATNKYKYQYGMQQAFRSLFFYKLKLGLKHKIAPMVGVNVEHMTKDKLSTGELDNSTGADVTFLNMGVNLISKKAACTMSYQRPIRQKYSSNQAKINGLVAMRYAYFLNKK